MTPEITGGVNTQQFPREPETHDRRGLPTFGIASDGFRLLRGILSVAEQKIHDEGLLTVFLLVLAGVGTFLAIAIIVLVVGGISDEFKTVLVALMIVGIVAIIGFGLLAIVSLVAKENQRDSAKFERMEDTRRKYGRYL